MQSASCERYRRCRGAARARACRTPRTRARTRPDTGCGSRGAGRRAPPPPVQSSAPRLGRAHCRRPLAPRTCRPTGNWWRDQRPPRPASSPSRTRLRCCARRRRHTATAWDGRPRRAACSRWRRKSLRPRPASRRRRTRHRSPRPVHAAATWRDGRDCSGRGRVQTQTTMPHELCIRSLWRSERLMST